MYIYIALCWLIYHTVSNVYPRQNMKLYKATRVIFYSISTVDHVYTRAITTVGHCPRIVYVIGLLNSAAAL